MKQKLSNCCQAPVTVGGIGDFDDNDKVVTRYYICSKCKKPCDLENVKKEINHFRRLLALTLAIPFIFILWLICFITDDKDFSFEISRDFFN